MKKIFKKTASGILVAALAAALVITPIFAADDGSTGESTTREYSDDVYSENAPDSMMDVDAKVLSGSTAAANTTLLSLLGIDVTSTDAAGVYNSAGANGNDSPINLLMFGSDWNISPDPYYYNFYYNFDKNPSSEGGNIYYEDEKSDGYNNDDGYDFWTSPFTLIRSDNKSGPSGAAKNLYELIVGSNTVSESNSNAAFFFQPDVLFSGDTIADAKLYSDASIDVNSTTSYTALSAYMSDHSGYEPLIVGGWSTKQYCINSNTYSDTEEMAEGIQTIAKTIETACPNRVGRYGDISDIADELYYFNVGVHDYVTDVIAAGDNDFVGTYYLMSPTYENGNITVNAVSGRYAQYLDEIGTDYSGKLDTSNMTLNDFVTNLKNKNVVVFDVSGTLKTALEAGGVKCVTLPTSVYGMTMQSADNMLGTAYCFGALYGDGDKLPSEMEMLAYWVTYFYHIDAEKHLYDAMTLMLGDRVTSSDLNSNYTDLVEYVMYH